MLPSWNGVAKHESRSLWSDLWLRFVWQVRHGQCSPLFIAILRRLAGVNIDHLAGALSLAGFQGKRVLTFVAALKLPWCTQIYHGKYGILQRDIPSTQAADG